MGNKSHDQTAASHALAEQIFPGAGEMASLIRTTDWSKTPLGPVESWPQSLRTAVSICLDSRHPIVLWWGRERWMFYNDGYRPMLGARKHPQFLGRAGQECWAEIWDIIGPMMDQVIATGEATWSEDLFLLMLRHGYPEETYFTFSYSPIRDEAGRPCGIFNACTESTARVLDKRRLKTLREMAVEARTANEAAGLCIEILRRNPRDIPFALAYLLDRSGERLHLAGSAGLPPETPASPLIVEVTGPDAAGWPLARVVAEPTRPANVSRAPAARLVSPAQPAKPACPALRARHAAHRGSPSASQAPHHAPLARRTVSWPVDRRWEPGAGNPHAGFCPGGPPKGGALPGPTRHQAIKADFPTRIQSFRGGSVAQFSSRASPA